MSSKALFLLTAFLASSTLSAATTLDSNSTAPIDLSSIFPQYEPNITFPSISTNTNANTVAACLQLSALSGFETEALPLAAIEPDYEYAKSHYWSAANADLTPQCVTFPTNAENMSQIVAIINQYDDVNFAVKSGGHNPNVGYSATDGGILIALSSMATTTVSDDQTIAYIGPGSRWVDVVDTLAPYNVVVVGGRLGDVGVGGYLLGGGLSFLSAAHGFACDSIVNYEVVLANASIVNANATTNQDLFWALKGGGNQFGIVTRYDMKTIPMDTVWGGTRIYTGNNAEALINATQDFTQNFHDNKAAVIVTGEIAIESLLEIFVVFFFYDAPIVPAGVFDMFDAILAIEDNTEVQSYANLLTANNDFNLYGLRYNIRGTALPVLPSPLGNDLFNYHYQTWREYVITVGAAFPDFIFSMAYQPLPTAIATASLAAGGNAISLDPNAGDHIWMEYDISWTTPAGDDQANTMATNITNFIDAYAKQKYAGVPSVGYVSGSGDLEQQQYNPIFLNDAMYNQLPLQSYGNGSYARLSAINRAYDPEGFFRTRTGGFKYT